VFGALAIGTVTKLYLDELAKPADILVIEVPAREPALGWSTTEPEEGF
jgi:hypothetical protein